MDPRTVPTTTATVTPAVVTPDDRPEAHNSGAAGIGACGQVRLQGGRTRTLEHRYQGACDFVPRPEVQDSVARHRAADGW